MKLKPSILNLKLKSSATHHGLVACLILAAISTQAARGQTSISYANPAVYTESAVSSTASSATVTVVDGTKYAVGDVIRFTGTTAASNPFGSTAASYFITSVSGNDITVSATPGGTALAATNTTTASTTSLAQDLLTGGNWTGGTAPNSNSSIASFGSTVSGVPNYVVNGNMTLYGLTYNGGGNSDLGIISGGDTGGAASFHSLTFATTDSSVPRISLGSSTTRLISLGGGTKLFLAGTQGLVFNSLAGGVLTGSGASATSTAPAKSTRLQNIDWSGFTGGITVERGELQVNASTGTLPGQTLTIGNAQTLTNARLAGLNLGTFGSTVDALNGNSLGRIYGASTLTVGTANGSGDFPGVIGVNFAGATSATNLTKVGTGTQIISGSIAGTGNVTINGGTLEVSGGFAISDTGAVSLANTAGVTFKLSGSESIGSLAGGGTTGGVVDLQANTLTVGGANTATSFAGAITGTGSLVKTGTNTLTLSNTTNSFNGGITISNGTLIGTGASGNNPFSTNAIQLGDSSNDNATLQLNSWCNLTSSNAVNVVGTGTHTIVGNHNNTGQTHILGGAITLNSNDLTIRNTLAAGYRIQGGVTGSGNLTFENNNTGATGLNIDIRSALNNTGSITNAGTGNYNLFVNSTNGGSIGANVTSIIQNSATSAFDLNAVISSFNTGSVEVRAGSMLLNNALSLRVAHVVAVGTGATLDVRQSNTIAGLTNYSGTGGTVTNNSTTDRTLTIGGSGTYAFSGTISDGGTNKLGVTKSGAGTQTLSGTITYSGNTTVENGTLELVSPSLSDTAVVDIKTTPGTGVLYLNYAGTDVVGDFRIDGVSLGNGLYDSTSHPGIITGSGKIQVGTVIGGYSTWATTNAGGQTAELDYDLDGVENGVEYFMNSAAGFTANPAVVGGTVTWPNGGNILSSAYGTQFKVQTSSNLGTWTDVLVTDPNLANTSGSVSYTLPTGAGKLFVRLVVTPN